MSAIASIGVLLHGFTGLPISTGIWVSGGVSLLYITVGGLWADLYTDFAQFIVQAIAGIVLFCAVIQRLGGASSVWTLWERLPEGHSHVFNGPYTPAFLVGIFAASMLSFNGGTWNLATRYIGARSAQSARRSALLSGGLYLVWPLILFFPMWAATLLLPNLAEPTQSYVLLTKQFLPAGLIGLVLASMFAATMSMTASDTNTISAVITRDLLPVISRRFRRMDQIRSLRVARISTLFFMGVTLVIGMEANRFGGILALVIVWFAALIGPVSVPMLFGLLPAFRHADARAAIAAVVGGFAAFALVRYLPDATPALRVLTPIATSFAVFSGMAWLNRHQPVPLPISKLLAALAAEEHEIGRRSKAVRVPESGDGSQTRSARQSEAIIQAHLENRPTSSSPFRLAPTGIRRDRAVGAGTAPAGRRHSRRSCPDSCHDPVGRFRPGRSTV